MKKNLLTIALVAGAILPASAQWYQVGGTVKVKPNTLKFVTGEHNVKGGSESNEGWVKVEGNFDVADAGEFRNEFTTPTEYGQLIIKDSSTSTGKVIGEYKTPGKDAFAYASLAVPYVGVSAEQIAEKAGITKMEWQGGKDGGAFNSNRWKNPVFVWNNPTYSLDNMDAADMLSISDALYKPTSYYAINNYNSQLDYRETDYEGTPANGVQTLGMTPFFVNGSDKAFTNFNRNKYGEAYGSYLKDAFVEVSYAEWGNSGNEMQNPEDFGDNYFYFGNPYTSNIDLTEALKNDNVIGVVQFTTNEFTETDKQGNSNIGNIAFNKKATYDAASNSFTGDADVLKLRPYHTFAVKTNGTDVQVTLNDEVKTFTFVGNEAPSYNARSAKRGNGLKQVRVKLNDADNNELYRTYVVASKSYKAEAKAGNEAYATNLSDDKNAIYTLQETENGEVSEALRGAKTYINGINEKDYVGKPVYVAHQVANPGKYTFSFDLSDGVNGANKFYFEDKETGKVKEITSNFTYTFNASESSTDRFRIYWNDKPVTEALSTNDVVSNETVVYKDNTNTFKVRFANDVKVAEVYVYNVLGQLVHSKNVNNTVVDYVLPLDNSSAAYVVKVVGDNGVVTTKKIVK